MNGMTVFRRAMRLLSYTDTDGTPSAAASGELYKRALSIVDQLCGELYQAETGELPPPLSSLSEPLPLSDKAIRILPYGVAMLLAASRADADNQQLFAALYESRRRTLTYPTRRTDVLPRGCDQ